MSLKKSNPIVDKSFSFAVKIVDICRYLQQDKKEYVLSKQLLRSGTSIGANVNEAQAAQSKKDFIAKMAISSKEARETKYWLELLIETNYLSKNDGKARNMVNENIELIKILTSIIKTSQSKANV
jgi:four helix bundle protein